MKKLIKLDNSCAVLALHHVSGVDEETVLRVCKIHDFDPHYGMEDTDWINAAKDLGITVRSVFNGSERLSSFVNKHQSGLYLIGTFNHLFALDNGIIIDPRAKGWGGYPGLGRLVKQAWKISASVS